MTYALIFGLICSLIPISLIARRFDWKSGLHLAHRLTMPMGFVVTILHLMQLLGLMSTPEQIDQLTSVALLPGLVACIQYTILKQFHTQPVQEDINNTHVRYASYGLIIILLSYTLHLDALLLVINFQAMFTVGMGVFVLTKIQKKFSNSESINIGQLTLQVSFINAFYCCIQLILIWQDPSFIGPYISNLGVGLLVGFTTAMLWEIRNSSVDGTKDKPVVSTNMMVGTYLMCFGPLLIISLNMQIWDITFQTTNLNRSTTLHQELLQKLVVPDADQKMGHLTVSSDKPSWIFINDKLVETSPIYREQLKPGEYTIKIASCPTYKMMNPADDIQWEEYWTSASDGTCRTPSEQEIDELISQQLAKEIVVDSTDNMEMVRIDYGPEVNFCCDEELTKTFQITMTDKPLVYAWSFVNGDWIHNDSSNN